MRYFTCKAYRTERNVILVKTKSNHSITTVTFLTRDQIDYMDKLGKDCLFKYGHKLSRSKILSDLVNVLMRLGIGMEGLDMNNESLYEAILKVIKHESRERHDI